MKILKRLYSFLVTFLAPVAGSVYRHLNVAELYRVVLAAGTSGGVIGILTAVLGSVTLVFPPADAALATFALTALIDVLRRLGHGTPLPKPAP